MEKNKVTNEQIKDIMNRSLFNSQTVFEKCTVVTCQLPNGFIIVESSAWLILLIMIASWVKVFAWNELKISCGNLKVTNCNLN